MQDILDPSFDGKRAEIARICSIFGPLTVLLPCKQKTPRDKAGRRMKAWQKKEPAVMDDPEWIAELLHKPQIGVLCRDGLICLDLDVEAALERWRAAHADLRTTVVTGRPGRAKYFFKVSSETEGTKGTLTVDGECVGEYLSTGAQAIVSGLHHETGQPYETLDDSPPLETTMEEVREWLTKAGITLKRRGEKCSVECRGVELSVQGLAVQPEGEDSASRKNLSPPSSPQSLETLSEAVTDVLARVEAHARAEARLATFPENLQSLYRKHVADAWPARSGERNAFVVAAMPALIRRVHPAVALDLALLWYDLHRELFADSLEDHRREAEAQCGAALATYRQGLPDDEGTIYDKIGEQLQAAFRIARDLARCPSRAKPPFFLLSEPELALRLRMEANEARRLLIRMASLGLVKLETKGTQNKKDVKGKATLWRWRLSLEPWPDGVGEE